ncbi:MAG: hypothetical protein U1F13_03900 [Acinetobacter parvus]
MVIHSLLEWNWRNMALPVITICPDAVQPMLDQQKDKEQAALTFSGARALIVQEVVDAILDNALKNKPLEIIFLSDAWRIVKAAVLSTLPRVSGDAASTKNKIMYKLLP